MSLARRVVGPVVVAAAVAGCRPARMPDERVVFIHDDIERGVELARASGRPLVVDVNAAWCLPCREMERVFAADDIRALRDRFVWVSLDDDSQKNAAFFREHRPPGLPTLWVLEPKTRKIVLEWVGSTDVATLRGLLLAGEDIARSGDVEDEALAARLAEALEAIAARAPTIRDRIAFDKPRLAAYLAAGTAEKAVPMFQQSESDVPDYFGSAAGLAKADLALGRLDEAAFAIDRARSRVAGWRSLEVLELAADIAHARGDIGEERAALAQAIGRTVRTRMPVVELARRNTLRKRLEQLPH